MTKILKHHYINYLCASGVKLFIFHCFSFIWFCSCIDTCKPHSNEWKKVLQKLLLFNKGKYYSQSHFQKHLKIQCCDQKQSPSGGYIFVVFVRLLVWFFLSLQCKHIYRVSFGSFILIPTIITIHAALLGVPINLELCLTLNILAGKQSAER